MRQRTALRCSTALLICASLVSCNALPRSGPSDESIRSTATTTLAAQKKVGIDYALVELDKHVVKYFDYTILNSLSKGFSGGKGPAPDTQLGVGDVVVITIFEAQSGGLFVPNDAGSRPGNYITLPAQTVDHEGMITVPYAGAVKAAGRNASDVQSEIERRLASRAIEPQVIITTTVSRSSSISVVGDVNSPARMELNPNGERVLDVIARAGGISAPTYETYVTIQRGSRKATVLFKTLVDNNGENIYLHPNDTVFVSRERRTYLVFGATEKAGRIDFEDSNLSLGEAIAKTGGLLDGRADPAQVFLYREVPRETLVAVGVDVSKFSGDIIPTVFRANLRDPAMFFAVQQFKMKDKDTIYVSNADSIELFKFLALVAGVSSTVEGVTSDVQSTQNSIEKIGN